MPHLKLFLFLGWAGLVGVFSLPQEVSAQLFVPKLGKIGFGIASFGVTDETPNRNYETKSGSGSPLRLDYVEYNTNLVIAFTYGDYVFDDNFVESYQYKLWQLGYRFDFGAGLATKTKILSSLYITIYPIFWGEEKFVTRDYQYKGKVRSNFGVDLGWRFNQTWDVFLSDSKREVGPFLVPTGKGVKKNTLTIAETLFGFHYAFGN